jgi:hypothetical protein
VPLILPDESILLDFCVNGTELAAEAFGAEPTNKQPFFAIAEHLPGPRGEATIDQLKLGSHCISGVYVKAGPNVIPATGLSLGIKFTKNAWVSGHQRQEYLLLEDLFTSSLFQIRDGNP